MTNRQEIGPQLSEAVRQKFDRNDKRALGTRALSEFMFAGSSISLQAWSYALPTLAEDADDE